MPSKKKKKGGKKKKAKGDAEEDKPPVKLYDVANAHEAKLLAQLENKTDWVYVDVKLVTWNYVDFTVCVRTQTPLNSIARMIEEKHGRISELKLYRSPPDEKNILDPDLTLAEMGIHGGAKEDEEKFTIFYNYKPAVSEPLLLKEPNLIVPDVPVPQEGAEGGETEAAAAENAN
eukprot:CAMPEP_0175098672 /NCGR_PEP_ID=MMETSP0086_2-20121207/5995_1 /TAXON_ID=136419 /ORGANISM="Unknown Unknown, Strain D1" /LENGTH=173 /DNA_ID=CAMNT_0016372365 /DNA_START=14 /DNA_END=535 /DNA_ORIENTATION=+